MLWDDRFPRCTPFSALVHTDASFSPVTALGPRTFTRGELARIVMMVREHETVVQRS